MFPSQGVRVRVTTRTATLAAAPALWLLLGWHRRWTNEDAFIVFRVVRQIQAGNGPVFNRGERVEAATSTLWTYLLTALDWVVPVLSLEWVAVLVGLVASVAGLLLAQRALLRTLAPRARVVPLGGMLVVALPPFWDFATSGLETGLLFGWLGLCADRVSQQLQAWDSGERRRIAPSHALLLGLGPLLRPDLVVVSAVLLGGLVLIGGLGWRNTLRAGAAAVALPAAYQLFRMGYYGVLVPTTALAKEGTRLDLDQGLTYLWDLVSTYVLVVPLVCAAVVGVGRWRAADGSRALRWCAPLLAAAGLAHAAAIVAIGGDYMHARMLLPSLFCLLASVAVVELTDGRARLVLVVAAVWAVGIATTVRWDDSLGIGPNGISDVRPVEVNFSGNRNPVTLGEHNLQQILGREPTAVGVFADGDRVVWEYFFNVVRSAPGDPDPPGDRPQYVAGIGAIGTWGYALGIHVHIVDKGGLADPIAARLPEIRDRAPGHRKALPDWWIVARFVPPEQHAAPSSLGGAGPEEAAQILRERNAATRALACEPLADVLESVEEPLTLRRFARNVLGAPRRTALRVPADPFEALAELC